MKTLEEYLEAELGNGVTTVHTLTVKPRQVVGETEDGQPILSPIRFYIHPTDVPGDTLDFQVEGNALVPDPTVIRATE